MVEDFNVLDSEGLIFLYTLLRVSRQDINSSISIILFIINPEMIINEFLSPADLSRAQTLCVYKSTKVVELGEYKYLMLRAF